MPGNGLRGTVGGRPARLGKPGFVDPGPLAAEVTGLQDAGATVVLVEHEGALLGAVAVRDEVRPEAAEAVARLKRQGVEVVMLTGDNTRTAAAIAAAAGSPTSAPSSCLRTRRASSPNCGPGGRWPWSATASTTRPPSPPPTPGSPWASWAAMWPSRPPTSPSWVRTSRRLPDALAHTRAARAVFTQNLLLSGGILVTLVPLAATGVLGLAAVVATHELAEVLVIANGIRAGRRNHLPRHPALRAARTAPRSTSRTSPHLVGASKAPAGRTLLPMALGLGETDGEKTAGKCLRRLRGRLLLDRLDHRREAALTGHPVPTLVTSG